MPDATKRFSSRVDNYVKYRPSYPPAVLDLLRQECGLTDRSVVADVGSGTGILAELFLKHSNHVFGIEPNHEMRQAGERLLRHYPRFQSVDATAEATTLAADSVDFVVAGQAFHWFDRERARAEFARILRPDGWVVLLWNDRRVASTPFLAAYEQLLQRYGTDYRAVDHKRIDADTVGSFFGAGRFRSKRFDNRQLFDREGLRGRLLSSSYTPEPGHPNYESMLDEIDRIFDTYQVDGRVVFAYDTIVYYGQLV